MDLRGADLSQPPPDLRQPPADLRQPPPDLYTPATCDLLVPKAYIPNLNEARLWTAYEVFFCRDTRGYYAMWNSCRHAGCQTSFNSGALTFDCPCHGSRYYFDGSVLNGPTTRPLWRRTLCWTDGTKQQFAIDNNSYGTDLSVRLT